MVQEPNNTDDKFYSGFVTLIGKPNAGKSTLVNAMSGSKVAITSPRPQTTRHKIMGIKNGPEYQIVFVDTPGVKEVKDELDVFMEKIYKEESRHADIVLFVADGSAPCSEDDINAKNLLKNVVSSKTPVFLVVNKDDKTASGDYSEEYKFLADFENEFKVSAVNGSGLDELIAAIIKKLPKGPAYFPLTSSSDQTPMLFAAEIVRENLLTLIRDEIPHGIFVHTDEMREGSKPGSLYFRITIYVERNAHKGIIIGKEGKMLKKIGMRSREELENHLNRQIYIDLWVKVKEKWKERKDLLRSWGYS